VPRRERVTRPASCSTFRWWLTVGWVSSSGVVSSHTHASPSAWALISDSSRSRVGDHLEPPGQLGRGVGGEWIAGQRRVAVRGVDHDPDSPRIIDHCLS
jgi:hypothetical protein